MPDTTHIKRWRERWDEYPTTPNPQTAVNAATEEMLNDLAEHVERLESRRISVHGIPCTCGEGLKGAQVRIDED